MHEPNDERDDHRLRVGSLFSGYGGLDIAVEQVFDARTVWSSEISEPVERVFAHHWPNAPNLGDITTIDWSSVEPVDVFCGGFPCQDVSTVGKMAGLAIRLSRRARRNITINITLSLVVAVLVVAALGGWISLTTGLLLNEDSPAQIILDGLRMLTPGRGETRPNVNAG